MKDLGHRYALHRRIEAEGYEGSGTMLLIGLAPDTSPNEYNGPDIRNAMALARANGCADLIMCNLFAAHIFKPRLLWGHPDPVGPDNDHHLAQQAEAARIVVAWWGDEVDLRGRDAEVLSLLSWRDVMCTGLTDSLEPKAVLPGDGLVVLQAAGEEKLW
jgi:hypothetical protein